MRGAIFFHTVDWVQGLNHHSHLQNFKLIVFAQSLLLVVVRLAVVPQGGNTGLVGKLTQRCY